MASLNKVFVMGRLTRAPDLRCTPKGTAIAELPLALNRVWTDDNGKKQEETTFVEVTLWARLAEIAQQYLSKGSPVFVEGRLQLDTWADKQTGQKRSKLRVVGENLQLVGDRASAGTGAHPSSPKPAAGQGAQPSTQRPWPPSPDLDDLNLDPF